MFTTLKALKWAHDQGVRQERVRIAAHLQAHLHGARVSRDVFDNMLREEMSRPKPNRGRVEQLQFDKAVYHRVEDIINDMFHPTGEYTPTSLMFPDGDPQRKVK